MVLRILPLKMVLIQKFSFYSHFEIAPCLFERIARQSCAFCNIAQRSVALLEEHIANQASLQLVYKVTERISALYCKTRNFIAQFAQINRALFRNVNKKKIFVLKPSSRVGLERPFKTASSLLKKFKTGQCL